MFCYQGAPRSHHGRMVVEDVAVSLSGGAPWGFRLQGGAEHERPLQVAKVPVECVLCVVVGSEGPMDACGVCAYVCLCALFKPGPNLWGLFLSQLNRGSVFWVMSQRCGLHCLEFFVF